MGNEHFLEGSSGSGHTRDEKARPATAGGKKALCLSSMLKDRIDSFQDRRERNRRTAWRLKGAIAGLGAVTTVLLGVDTGSVEIHGHAVHVLIRNVALCCSALITVFSAREAFFDNRGLWIKYTRARAQLFAIRAELKYLLAGCDGEPAEGQVDELFRRFEDVLTEVNDSWLQARLGSQSQPKSSGC